MKIGNVECGNIILAPMAGITDMPFRALCKEQGATFTYTEMISAKALYYKNKNTLPLLQVAKGESPIAVQLFGNEPELLAQEALKLEEGPYDIFDVNMGCPVPKVVNNGEGSALMKDPKKVEEIVSAMTKVLHKPVTIKIRKGFTQNQINAVEVAKRAEDACRTQVGGRFHPHPAPPGENLPEQKQQIIRSRRMLDETGCDAVMIARGARGNPWIFREVAHYLKTGEELPRPSVDEVKNMILRHAQMLIDFCGENMAIRQMRKHAGYYVTGYPDASRIRREVNLCVTFSDLERTLTKWEV